VNRWPRRNVLATATGLGVSGTAFGQAPWPTRPVTLLVPFAPGGASDIAARAFSARLAERHGQPVVVDNRPAPMTARGTDARAGGARRPHADGRLYRRLRLERGALPKPGYDPLADFAPVTLVITTPNVLVVNPRVAPVATLPSSSPG
jgi:tripartite-type tricarboxylate transporter receptor subunit TctC